MCTESTASMNPTPPASYNYNPIHKTLPLTLDVIISYAVKVLDLSVPTY